MSNDYDREQQEIPSIVPDADDIEMRKRDIDTARQPALNSSKNNSTSKSLAWLWLGMIFTTLLGIEGFYFYKQLQIQNEVHGLAVQRIAYLENRLSSTDTNMVESAEQLLVRFKAMDESLKEAHSEIRKLWGVSYDKNRKTIAENVAIVSSLEKKSQIQAKQLKKHDQLFFEKEKLMLSMQSKIADMNNELKQLDNSVNEAIHRAEMAHENGDQTRDRVEALNQSVAELEKLNKAFEKRLTTSIDETGDALKGLDIYRKGINREIETIREELLRIKQADTPSQVVTPPQIEANP